MVIHSTDIHVIEERLRLKQMTPTWDFVSYFNLFVTVQIFEHYCLPHFLLIGAPSTFGPGSLHAYSPAPFSLGSKTSNFQMENHTVTRSSNTLEHALLGHSAEAFTYSLQQPSPGQKGESQHNNEWKKLSSEDTSRLRLHMSLKGTRIHSLILTITATAHAHIAEFSYCPKT